MAKQKTNKAQTRASKKPRISRDLAIARSRANKLKKMQKHMAKQPDDFTTEYAMQCHVNDPPKKR